MKKLKIIILGLIMLLLCFTSVSYSTVTPWIKTLRTGGTSAALDSIDGNDLNDGDIAFVYEAGGIFFHYLLDADLGESEDDPRYIVPDTNPGSKVFVLVNHGYLDSRKICIEDPNNASNYFCIDYVNDAVNIDYVDPNGTTTDLIDIDSSGNVGIRTTAPQQALNVAGVSSTSIDIIADSDADGADTDSILRFYIDGVAGTGTQKGSVGYDQGSDLFTVSYGALSNYHLNIDSSGNVGIGITSPVSKLDVDGGINQRDYYWVEEFDDEASGVQFESGLKADFWISAGTNYSAANVTYAAGPGGTLAVATAGSDDDSVTELGVGNFAINSNPILEARYKIADANSVYIAVGFVEGAYADKASPDDDIAVVGIDSDTNCTLYLYTNDNNGGLVSDNLGVDLVNGTYVIIRIDLTDTEQPRVWINNTEIAAGSITGTVQAGITVAPYFMVQSLSGAADTLTMDKIKGWQD